MYENSFELGAIVTRPVSRGVGRIEYFIVENSFIDDEGQVFYDILEIYPVMDNLRKITVRNLELLCVAVKREKQWNVIMNMIEKKRKEKDMNPLTLVYDYVILMKRIKLENEPKFISSPQNTHNLAVLDMTDEVQYHNFKTTDECLDSINRLRELAKCLKTDYFDDKIGILFNRLKELVEESNKKKNY